MKLNVIDSTTDLTPCEEVYGAIYWKLYSTTENVIRRKTRSATRRTTHWVADAATFWTIYDLTEEAAGDAVVEFLKTQS